MVKLAKDKTRRSSSASSDQRRRRERKLWPIDLCARRRRIQRAA